MIRVRFLCSWTVVGALCEVIKYSFAGSGGGGIMRI